MTPPRDEEARDLAPALHPPDDPALCGHCGVRPALPDDCLCATCGADLQAAERAEGGPGGEAGGEPLEIVPDAPPTDLRAAGEDLYRILQGGMTADYDAMTAALGAWRAAADAPPVTPAAVGAEVSRIEIESLGEKLYLTLVHAAAAAQGSGLQWGDLRRLARQALDAARAWTEERGAGR